MIQTTYHPSWSRNRISCANCAVFVDPVHPLMIFKWESKTLLFYLDMRCSRLAWLRRREDGRSPPEFSPAMRLLLKIVAPWIAVHLALREVSWRGRLAGRRVSDAPTADELCLLDCIAAEVLDELLNSELVIL